MNKPVIYYQKKFIKLSIQNFIPMILKPHIYSKIVIFVY